jgi:glycosyltransferase involved in cell wall biosynthesis
MSIPLLSICIPTYNRARLLDSALFSLVPQVIESRAAVELVVSDNCSPDDTAEVVARYVEKGAPIRYCRNERNLGAARNVLRLAGELARGEYCWVLGDDDLVRPDGVSRITSVLLEHPEVDYVFVNVSILPPEERTGVDRPPSGADSPDARPTKCMDLSDRPVAAWEELIDPAIDDVYLGSLMCSVFRLRKWREYPLACDPDAAPFSTLEMTYPHSMVLAHTMRGSKAYYIGHPCVNTYFGRQEWLGFLPLIIGVRLQELLDLYLNLGIDRDRIDRCRLHLLGNSRRALEKLLLESTTPGREVFSFWRFMRQNRNHLLVLASMTCGIGITALRKLAAGTLK